ncbi:MAG: hypothetical protein AUJ07_01585 [Crenarchaeota archaeon 13_1_40CM_3_53_5]|nr:MAG: hypothetical protein AUJ07_01585 [Crenarchaeota archaeon 13_1_40CM_3_53_5]
MGTQVLSLVYWISFPFATILFPFAQLDATISQVLAPTCPALLLMLIYSWIGILIYRSDNWFSRRTRTFLGPVLRSVQSLRLSATTSSSMTHERLIDHPRVLLLTGIASALFLAVIPYRPDLNTTGSPVGIDLHWYIEWISPMLSRPPQEALSYAMGVASGGSRPLLLIPVYLVVSTGAVSLVQALEALPAVLGPLLVLSVYFFVREAFGDGKLAGIAGLSTAFSFYITVGIWAAYYANMLGLSVGFAFLTILFRYWKKQKVSQLVLVVLLSLGLLLSHPWTWIIFLTVTVTFAATIWWDTRKWILLRTVGLVLAIDLSVDTIKSLVFGAQVSAQEASASFVPALAANQVLNFWPNLVNALLVPYDGLLANTLILALSLLAVLTFKSNPTRRLLLLWTAVSSLPIIVLSDLAQTRVYYDLPFPVFFAIGLLILLKSTGRTLNSNLLFLIIVLALANYAFRSITGLVATPF